MFVLGTLNFHLMGKGEPVIDFKQEDETISGLRQSRGLEGMGWMDLREMDEAEITGPTVLLAKEMNDTEEGRD